MIRKRRSSSSYHEPITLISAEKEKDLLGLVCVRCLQDSESVGEFSEGLGVSLIKNNEITCLDCPDATSFVYQICCSSSGY